MNYCVDSFSHIPNILLINNICFALWKSKIILFYNGKFWCPKVEEIWYLTSFIRMISNNVHSCYKVLSYIQIYLPYFHHLLKAGTWKTISVTNSIWSLTNMLSPHLRDQLQSWDALCAKLYVFIMDAYFVLSYFICYNTNFWSTLYFPTVIYPMNLKLTWNWLPKHQMAIWQRKPHHSKTVEGSEETVFLSESCLRNQGLHR